MSATSPTPHGALLAESLAELDRALERLRYSVDSCSDVREPHGGFGDDDLERIEALTSRFARTVDIMSNRALRAIDRFEMFEAGTLLDIANRAEKRGLIESVDWLRELKDTRNRIAHDYAGERLPEILAHCRSELPRLLAACKRIIAYGKTLLKG